MANITLAEYQSAVLHYLSTNVAWLTFIGHPPDIGSELATPCAFFSVLSWEKSDRQKGNGQLTLDVSCEVLVVYGLNDPDAQIKVGDAALTLSQWIDECRFELEIHPATLIRAEADTSNPDLEGYAVWSVRWRQPLTSGQTEISAETVTPEIVMVGYEPKTGAEHISDYEVALNTEQEL